MEPVKPQTMKQPEVVIVIHGDKYNYKSIVRRTVKAPIRQVKISYLMRAPRTGIELVDDGDIRVTRIDKRYFLLSGFNKIQEAIKGLSKDELNILKTDAKEMSAKFFEMCRVKIPAETPNVLNDAEVAELAAALAKKFSSNQNEKRK